MQTGISSREKWATFFHRQAELKLIEGGLPKRVISLVIEWAFEHRDELMEDWELAITKRPLRKIPPLV
jgi:hypothetical protein